VDISPFKVLNFDKVNEWDIKCDYITQEIVSCIKDENEKDEFVMKKKKNNLSITIHFIWGSLTECQMYQP